MFVGDTGIGRVIRRTIEVMRELNADDPGAVRKLGAVDLPTLQRYLNFWFSSSLDLFGADVSSNAASYFANGIKGRPDEATYEDHVAQDQTYELEQPDGEGGVKVEAISMRNAMNEITRNAYVKDCGIGVTRWNRLLQKAGIPFELRLPSVRFRRSIGSWAGVHADPSGRLISAEEWRRRQEEWLPSEADRAFVHSLMQQVVQPGKMAAWIAPPDRGINSMPVEYQYVHIH